MKAQCSQCFGYARTSRAIASPAPDRARVRVDRLTIARKGVMAEHRCRGIFLRQSMRDDGFNTVFSSYSYQGCSDAASDPLTFPRRKRQVANLDRIFGIRGRLKTTKSARIAVLPSDIAAPRWHLLLSSQLGQLLNKLANYRWIGQFGLPRARAKFDAQNLHPFLRCRRPSSSAICTALSAAPLRRLSETHHSDRPLSTVGSSRTRLT